MAKGFAQFVAEDGAGGGAGGGAAIANSSGTGNIAGLGVTPQGKPAKWGEPGVDNRKRKKLKERKKVDEATETEIEKAAKAVHDQWAEKQKADGHEEHLSPDGTEDYMVPYHQLSDDAKELDRGAVRAVLDALGEETDPEKFAGAAVFEVDMDRLMNVKKPKHPRHRYSKYVGIDETGEKIRQHGRKNKGDILLKEPRTGVMTYLRRKPPVGE